jgi:hypothetical protein
LQVLFGKQKRLNTFNRFYRGIVEAAGPA